VISLCLPVLVAIKRRFLPQRDTKEHKGTQSNTEIFKGTLHATSLHSCEIVMEKISREFQVFVKPVGANCNLKCNYCYYLEKSDLYPDQNRILMSDEILETYIIQHINASKEDVIHFSWHGGEPLLAGIDFYRKALKIQSDNKPAGKTILNGIQTNGTLLDDEWCCFLADEGFVVGISIDGTAEMHNIFRRTKNDKPTFEKVNDGIRLLKEHHLIPEILCVVNSENVRFPHATYSIFKQLGAKYITFIPLVIPEKLSPEGVSKSSVPAEEFGTFLAEIFDEWVENDIGDIKIQIFEESIRSAFNQEHTLCIFKVNCGGVPVVEHNGDFYNCDHFVDGDHLLGNISANPLSYYLDNKRQIEFGMAKSLMLPDYCIKCEVRSMCNGECPKNRFIFTPEGDFGLNYLCKGYKYFFNHCRPFVEAVAETWKNQKI
jgi:uncharacterized protein